MYNPPPDRRSPPFVTEPTAQGILVSYLMVASIPLLLWVVDNPFAGVVGVVALVGLVRGVRHVVRLRRCLHECGAFSLTLGDRLLITVTRRGDPDPC